MSDTFMGKGSCLCGTTGIQARKVAKEFDACHCSMCRKWGGGPLLAIDCGTEVTLIGEEDIGVYGSSEWAERGFCKKCGTHLFYRVKESGQYIVPLGLLDTSIEGLAFANQIFIDEKPAYYHFGNKTLDMTGAEVFAKFTPSQE